MADIALLYSHKEVRLNLESTIPSSTIAIRLPAHGTSSWSSKGSQKRPLPTDIPPAEDESAFRLRNLASASSIFYRGYHRSPRGFLWRILEDGKVLSIQAADLCKQDKALDTYLTLRLILPSPIRPVCIAFTDEEQHDIVNAFFLTESNLLYTLNLRPEFFRKRSSTEDNVGDWCKTYISSAFGFKHPHRLVALSSEQLLVSLHDGGLLRLDRVLGEDSSVWKETFYNEGGWTHGLRSLIPFQGNHTVRDGKVNFELPAITSIASPSTTIDGSPFVFTVSLDHRIRAWNLSTGKVAYSGDLLNQERLPNELGRYIIHPSQSQLIKTYLDIERKVVVVTFSPVGAGQFKFWTLIPSEDGNLELEDLFPDVVLEPPAPTTADVWTLADFTMAFDQRAPNCVRLWALWKNNTTYRLHNLDFSLDSPTDTQNSWAVRWGGVASETLADTLLPTISSSDPADITEKWADYILYPGRFTTATIETALAIYEKGLGNSKNLPVRASKNISKRICSLVASTVIMDRNSEGGLEYEKFRAATDAQWRRFYRLLVEIDKQRGEALSLAFDTEHEMTWVVTADGLSAIRDCSSLEKIFHNLDNAQSGASHSVSQLVTAALHLRDTFSNSFLQSCDTALTAQLFNTPPTDLNSVQALWDSCNLTGQILDDDYRQIISTLGGDLHNVTADTYSALLSSMTDAEEMDQRLERFPLATLGRKAVIGGVQEMIELHRSICFDQLVLLMFFDVDVEAQDIDLKTFPIYTQLFAMLKRLELLSWLFKAQITMPVARLEKPSPTKRPEDMKTVTVLEGCLGHLLGLVSHSGESTAALLTELMVRVCDPDGEYELQSALIQCFLLKLDRSDLALDFSRFCDQDPFSTYVQGRARLAAKDFSTAATFFKKAAFGLSHPDPRIASDRHSSGLLDETEWNLLYAGLPRYYYHIVSLFDKEKLYSFVIDFARIALQFATVGSKEDYVLDIRTELLSRLFNAALQTSRYDTAYSTLTLITNQALQFSTLRALVSRMCENSSASELVDLPFIGLQNTVDVILAQKCQSIVDVSASVPYHKILYAWRIRCNNFRGAAAVSLDRLQKLRQSGEGDKALGNEARAGGLETPVTKQYLMLINALSCVDPKQAWILSEPLPNRGGPSGSNSPALGKRKVMTLDDARKEYQEELDRIAAIENNQFTFEGGDEMDLV